MNNLITPIDFGDDEKINALIIDIGKNNLEVRGYRYTDHELAARMKLVDLDGDTFTLKQTHYVEDDDKSADYMTWKEEEDDEIIEIDFILNEAKTEITLKPGGLGGIPPMTKTVFTQLEALKGTWKNTEKQMTMVFEDKNFTYTEGTNVYSGTWDASGDNDGIIRTIMTKAEGVSGFSFGGASPYVLDKSGTPAKLTITYPDQYDSDGKPTATDDVPFTKQP